MRTSQDGGEECARAECAAGASSLQGGAPEARALRLGAITPFTTIDFPGRLSAVAFLQGCPWDCVYCQNPWLRPFRFDPRYEHSSWEKLQSLLSRRRGLLDAVVFSGGEPLADPALPSAIREVRKMGFLAAVHTCGAYPRVLERILPELAWVGLDVKAPLDDAAGFRRIIRAEGGAPRTKRCLELLLGSGVAFECRTTCHPDFLSEAALLEIGQSLAEAGVRSFALQPFRQPPGLESEALFSNCPPDYPSLGLQEKLRPLFDHFEVRR